MQRIAILLIFIFAVISGATQSFAQMELPTATRPNNSGGEPARPSVAPDQPISAPLPPANAQLRQLIDQRLSAFVDRKPEQDAVRVFYQERNFQPLWTGSPEADARGAAAIDFLRNVTTEGLDPQDYPTSDLSAASSDEDAAKRELQLTGSLLKYARHASSGRVAFTRVSGSILYPSQAVDPGDVLARLAETQNVPDVLSSFEPQHPAFKALKAELARALSGKAIDESPNKHHRDARADARGRAELIDRIIANMERWRWLPRDLGAAYVMVNVPDYTLEVIDNGRPIWHARIVVGKPGKLATPLLTETMKYLTINPTWNVPPSIIRNEYLPALERDPDALDRIGLKVAHNSDGSLRVYQPPGERNALGRIRFNFPNPFLVYQHDTPNKKLFERSNRALSHGCMRVQNPEQYAEILLSLSQPEQGITAARIRSYYGDEERTIKLQNPIPVHVTYQTAFVEKGRLQLRPDIYGLDAAILKLMRGSERQIADRPITRDYASSSKPVMARLPSHHRAREDRAAPYFAWDRGGSSWGHGFGPPVYGNPYAGGRPFDRAVGIW
ncbi:MAG TPA: L,D-transpeptidase family protein [Pseudolabrys sp.]|nr:L,D-transpeptidase family protein [Pseudolabrys sp.]